MLIMFDSKQTHSSYTKQSQLTVHLLTFSEAVKRIAQSTKEDEV